LKHGLGSARAAQPDFILLDARLTRMDNFSLCRTLRQELVVPIILLSACDREMDRVKHPEIAPP